MGQQHHKTPNKGVETESQKTDAPKNRPGTGLDPEHGHEISRTGKVTPMRDVKSAARDLDEDDGESEGDLSRSSQNAVGGKTR
jgi:hypothetical protein